MTLPRPEFITDSSGPTVPIPPMAMERSREFMVAANRTTTLYALADDFAEVLRLIEQAETEEDAEQFEIELNKIAGSIQHKAESIAGLMQWCDGLADMRKAEAKRMAASAAVFEHRADRLREYVKRNMEIIGVERIDTSRFTLKIRQNPPRVEVLEAAMVPRMFERTKTTIDIDKRAILDHVKKTGEVVPGVSIERGTRLEIS